ncbi:MAG: ABC transporter permease subunit [Promethearchaeia archaeon]
MKDRVSKLLALLKIELGISYRFPVAEGVISFLFLIPIWNLLFSWFDRPFGMGDFDIIKYAVIGFPKLRLERGILLGSTWLAIIVSVVSAFAIAKSFEDNYVQTLLTYPVNRTTLFLGKVILVILIPAGAITASILFAVAVTFPILPSLGDVILTLLATWLSVLFFASLSSLVAVVSQRVSVTAVFGIVYAFVTSYLQDYQNIPGFVRVVVNPFNAAAKFLRNSAYSILYEVEALPLTALHYGFVISFIMSMILLAMALLVFRRSEI